MKSLKLLAAGLALSLTTATFAKAELSDILSSGTALQSVDQARRRKLEDRPARLASDGNAKLAGRPTHRLYSRTGRQSC